MIIQAVGVFAIVVAAQVLLVAKVAEMLSSTRRSARGKGVTTGAETFWAADLRL